MDYGRWAERTTRLPGACEALGVGKGDRVENLRVELAPPSRGLLSRRRAWAVLHTVNIRLSAADITYIVNHAATKS